MANTDDPWDWVASTRGVGPLHSVGLTHWSCTDLTRVRKKGKGILGVSKIIWRSERGSR